MKKQCLIVLTCGLLLAMLATPAFSQAMAKVKGTALDQQGNPIVGATVEMKNLDNGTTQHLKTDKKGQFYSIAVSSGKYNVKLMKDGTQLYFFNNVPISLAVEENVIDFKLNELAAADRSGKPATPGQGQAAPKLTEEQKKQLEEQRKEAEAVQKENTKIGSLNSMLATSRTAAQAGNYDEAINTMKQATAADPNRDLLWAVLGSYYLDAAKKPGTDAATKTAHYTEASGAYKKALELCAATPTASTCKDTGSYHNNLGQALAQTGHTQEAMAEYTTAAQLDPTRAAQYYFNLGAILTNAGKTDEANAAFDKAIAADPNKAEAYYQKGVNLLAKATIKDGKMVAPPAAEQSLQKYLQLQPDGQFAASAKELITTLGSTVQTSYGTQKKPATKK
jgi:tetratricopeptide (TPR) repeat protein